MSGKIPYPALNDDGWIYETGKKLDAIMADFYMAEWSQNLLFHGHISSLPYILQNTNGDTSKAAVQARAVLNTQLARYFDFTNVEVSEYTTDDHSTNGLHVTIQVGNVTEELITLHNLVTTSGTMISNIQKQMTSV